MTCFLGVTYYLLLSYNQCSRFHDVLGVIVMHIIYIVILRGEITTILYIAAIKVHLHLHIIRMGPLSFTTCMR